MKILVCIKQVPESYNVRLDPVTKTIQRDQAKAILNPFDHFALEEALRIKERCGGTVTCITMGSPAAEAVIRDAIAMGADDGCLLSDRKMAGADTLATAYTLACGIRTLGTFDLIICGKMATDGDTAQVPPMLAEMLVIPCMTDVCSVISCENGRLQCQRMHDDGYGNWECSVPALITVTKECNFPRLMSIAGMLRAHDAQIRRLEAADLPMADLSKLGLGGSATQVKRTFVPVRQVETRMLSGTIAEQAAEAARVLLEKGRDDL